MATLALVVFGGAASIAYYVGVYRPYIAAEKRFNLLRKYYGAEEPPHAE